MRIPALPLLVAPILAAAPPSVLPMAEAEAIVLDHLDLHGSLKGLDVPKVARRDRSALAWLLSAVGDPQPRNPFPPGDPRQAEAKALCDLFAGKGALPEAPLLELPATQAGFWRWGLREIRSGHMKDAERQRWEDLLLRPGRQVLVRENALRHALAFALARKDEARFAALKATYGAEAPEAFRPWLAALGLLGGPAPSLKVWSMPDLSPVSLNLAQGGIRHIWICPMPPGQVGSFPPGVTWIIPTRQGLVSRNEDVLDEESRAEAQDIMGRLPQAGLQPYLAPLRMPLDQLGFLQFPVLISLDAEGRVSRILMAEAALFEGHHPTLGPKIPR